MKFLYCKRALFVLPLAYAASLPSFSERLVDWSGGVVGGSGAHEDAKVAAAAGPAQTTQITTLQSTLAAARKDLTAVKKDLATATTARDAATTAQKKAEQDLAVEQRRVQAFTLASNLQEEQDAKAWRLPKKPEDILTQKVINATWDTLKDVPKPEIRYLLATAAKQVAESKQEDLDEAASAASRFCFALLADTWKSGTKLPEIHNSLKAVKEKDSLAKNFSSDQVMIVVQTLLSYLPYGVPDKTNEKGFNSLDYVSEALASLFDGVGCSSDALSQLHGHIKTALSSGDKEKLEAFFNTLSSDGAVGNGDDDASVASLVSSSSRSSNGSSSSAGSGDDDGSTGGDGRPDGSPKVIRRAADLAHSAGRKIKDALVRQSKSASASAQNSPVLGRRVSTTSAK